MVQGRRWWQTGDYPWQVLACCMEIVDVLRSSDPDSYITHIPVHQVHACSYIYEYIHELMPVYPGVLPGLLYGDCTWNSVRCLILDNSRCIN